MDKTPSDLQKGEHGGSLGLAQPPTLEGGRPDAD
jgi:hypothetical protein